MITSDVGKLIPLFKEHNYSEETKRNLVKYFMKHTSLYPTIYYIKGDPSDAHRFMLLRSGTKVYYDFHIYTRIITNVRIR